MSREGFLLRYLVHRLILTLLSLAGVFVLSFLLIHFVPGDPVDQMLGEQATAQDRQNLRHELGLDRPLLEQFAAYVTGQSLNRSLVTREPVKSEILRRFPATAELALSSLFLALLWGLPLGLWAAIYANRLPDLLANMLSTLGMSVPGIFLGPALVYIFAIKLDWFPVSERGGLESLILPATSLALPLGSVIARMTRAATVEVLSQDYMRTARAKGAGPYDLYFRHALKNALIPLITIVGLQLGALLTGTVITETIFDWPGIGTLIYTAIQKRDYPLVQGCVLFVAIIYVFVNLATDLCYAVVNPKVRLD